MEDQNRDVSPQEIGKRLYQDDRTITLHVEGKEEFISNIHEITQALRELNEELAKAGLHLVSDDD